MIEVIPLKYGATFKRVFSRPEIFCHFASDVLNLPINVDRVETEYEYPQPVGFVRSRYDLFAEDTAQRIVVEIQQHKETDFFDRFLYYHLTSMIEQVRDYKAYWFNKVVYTIVVLTSIPKDDSVDFSCAISDFNPVDEYDRRLTVYPHRLIFLAPRKVSANTPPKIAKWLNFIADSLDGKMNENDYSEPPFSNMLNSIQRINLSPEELAEIINEATWEQIKMQSADAGEARGIVKGRAEGEVKGKAEMLKRLITRRFGQLPEWAETRIDTANVTQLELWAEKFFIAQTIDTLL
jgi:hypothetical protein